MDRLVVDTLRNRSRYSGLILGRWMGWLHVEALPSPDMAQMLDDLAEPDVRKFRVVLVKHRRHVDLHPGALLFYPREWVELRSIEEPLR